MQYTVKNNVKWMFGEYFESMKDKGDDVLVHISDDLWKVIVLKQPCLQEE